jgi:hypothetical protein
LQATLDADGRTLHLEIPDLAPTMGIEIRYDLKSRDGGDVQGMIHSTIHQMGR